MKILLLSDLHGEKKWFDWALEQPVDAIFIAGDLLNAFSEKGLLSQMSLVEEWTARASVPVVFCSGNHDANAEPLFLPRRTGETIPKSKRAKWAKFFSQSHWMDALAREGCVIVDGVSDVVEIAGKKCIVTTIPYDFTEEEAREDLWQSGRRLREQHRVPWMVLHHDPPEGEFVGGTMGNPNLPWLIREYCPDFLLSGHLHSQPYEGDFAEKIATTWCFNPGVAERNFTRRASFAPNHIVLDLAAGTAEWNADPLEGTRRIKKTVLLENKKKTKKS